MQTMDQFSHDLTLALEQTCGVRVGRWGQRRRTRSTGNLPCAPQPTEDSSSSPPPNEIQQQNAGGLNSMHSDSDDRQDLRLSFQKSTRNVGNFESDSLNENFSPARFFRPNTRRKRKFKRMAVEYETTPSTPGPSLPGENSFIPGATEECNASNEIPTTSSVIPLTGAVKKRVLKHVGQDNYRTNLFFCGKRKRSHRDRYHDHHIKQHSSSVPRQTHIHATNTSYLEHQYKTRTRSFSSATRPNCEKIMPLNKLLISKIEKIAQQQLQTLPTKTVTNFGNKKTQPTGFQFTPIILNPKAPMSDILTDIKAISNDLNAINKNTMNIFDKNTFTNTICTNQSIISHHHLSQIPENIAVRNTMPQKSGSFDSTFSAVSNKPSLAVPCLIACSETGGCVSKSHLERKTSSARRKHHKNNRLRREQIRAKLQFDVDPLSMECSDLNDFLSSSSLSSSDSEGDETNESDREGDDELTDWPGNEGIVNFASKNDFKRKTNSKKTQLPFIKSSDDYPGGDDDTLMSGDEVPSPLTGQNFLHTLQNKPSTFLQSQPIAITSASNNCGFVGNCGSFGATCGSLEGCSGGGSGGFGSGSVGGNVNEFCSGFSNCSAPGQNFRFPVKQIESEMSGETSNPFLSSPPCQPGKVREILAGCRRIKEERPGFSIKTSVNERLARFLQDGRQTRIRLPDLELHEHESLTNYAKLYSLEMVVDNGCAVLTKTSNTTQSVKVDQHNFGNRFFLSDFKRVRCYDEKNFNHNEDEFETVTKASATEILAKDKKLTS